LSHSSRPTENFLSFFYSHSLVTDLQQTLLTYGIPVQWFLEVESVPCPFNWFIDSTKLRHYDGEVKAHWVLSSGFYLILRKIHNLKKSPSNKISCWSVEKDR
jgi:hypothetical protein